MSGKIFRIILSALISVIVTGDCRGRTHVIRNGKEYRFFPVPKTYSEAQEECQQWGSSWKSANQTDLMKEIDAELQSCLETMIKETENYGSDIDGVFLGGETKENGWYWHKGEHIPLQNETGYQKWASEQPKHISKIHGKRCLTANRNKTKAGVGDWKDISCNTPMYYMCQRDIEKDLLWGYSKNTHAIPPTEWDQISPICKEGTRQSPQDVDVSRGLGRCGNDEITTALRWESNEGTNASWIVKNTGRMIEIRPKGSLFTYFDGSDTRYSVNYMHLKWGVDYKSGSEHTLGGVRHAGELQIFHHSHDGEVQALSFLLQERSFIFNTRWNPLLKAVIRSVEAGKSSEMKAPAGHIMGLLEDSVSSRPYATARYNMRLGIRYQGSLTQPPCTENVVWTVYPRPVQIALGQLELLRRLPMEGREDNNAYRRMTETTRPIQSRNSRHCYVRS